MEEFIEDNLHYVRMGDGKWWAFPIKEIPFGTLSREREERIEKIERSFSRRVSKFIFGVRR